MRRYENRSTMMTSNRPIEEWGKLLSDVPAAGAILDRLLHHAELIAITGRSYRLQLNVDLSSKRRTGYWLIIDEVLLLQEVFKFEWGPIAQGAV
jgi:hypothetical protein